MEEGGIQRSGPGWTVPLPQGARPPYRVWVNGVEQREGMDYVVEGRSLRFFKPLAKEGRLGFWRWALMFLGIAGTYRKHDSVDVQYTADGGRRLLATGLDIEVSRGGPGGEGGTGGAADQ